MPHVQCGWHPLTALPLCSYLPTEFIQCNEPVDHNEDQAAKVSLYLEFSKLKKILRLIKCKASKISTD